MNEVNEIETITNDINITEITKEVCEALKKLDTYNGKVGDYLSTLDKKIDFWEHIIELNKLNTSQIYRVYKEIKRLRTLRRKVKNDMELLRTFTAHRQKLNFPASVEGVSIEMFKINSLQSKRQYSYSEYTEEEIKEILGKNNEGKAIENN